MRPRGPSSSSPSNRYVGQVAVQNPQCTQARRIASASLPSCVSRIKSASAVCIVSSGLQAGIETAGVEDAVRIEMRLEPAMEQQQRLGQWMERAGGLVGGPEERRVTAVRGRIRTDSRRVGTV